MTIRPNLPIAVQSPFVILLHPKKEIIYAAFGDGVMFPRLQCPGRGSVLSLSPETSGSSDLVYNHIRCADKSPLILTQPAD